MSAIFIDVDGNDLNYGCMPDIGDFPDFSEDFNAARFWIAIEIATSSHLGMTVFIINPLTKEFIGFVSFYFDGNIYGVEVLYVKPEYRSKGYARLLAQRLALAIDNLHGGIAVIAESCHKNRDEDYNSGGKAFLNLFYNELHSNYTRR